MWNKLRQILDRAEGLLIFLRFYSYGVFWIFGMILLVFAAISTWMLYTGEYLVGEWKNIDVNDEDTMKGVLVGCQTLIVSIAMFSYVFVMGYYELTGKVSNTFRGAHIVIHISFILGLILGGCSIYALYEDLINGGDRGGVAYTYGRFLILNYFSWKGLSLYFHLKYPLRQKTEVKGWKV